MQTDDKESWRKETSVPGQRLLGELLHPGLNAGGKSSVKGKPYPGLGSDTSGIKT